MSEEFFNKARKIARDIDRGTYMKETDEYKKKLAEAPYHPGYEDAVINPTPKRKDLRKMSTGLFGDVQISNPARDKAWEAFIKRKDVAGWAVNKEGFPLNGFYDVWCIAWSKGWDTGADRIAELEARLKQEFDYAEKLLKEREQ